MLNIYDDYRKLAEIFIYLGYIEINDERNQWAYKNLLKNMLSKNKFTTAMQILGYCAEAVIVRRCNENSEINKIWLNIAHKWENYDTKIPNETTAIGTGHHYTQTYYPYRYNPTDTQCDIIWINKENNEPLVNGFPFGSYIGLQVKTSIDSKNNIKNDLLNKKYYVPIVYFDIFNDHLKTVIDIQECYDGCLNYDFISAKEIDPEAYREVCGYYDIIMALCNKKMPINEFMYHARNCNKLGNAVVKTITAQIPSTSNSIMA